MRHHDAVDRDLTAPTVARLQLIALVGLVAGVWATWPLWTADRAFPQIPWITSVAGAPGFVDWLLLGLGAVSACGVVAGLARIPPAGVRAVSRVAFSVAAVGLVLLDQHRLQVWVLHLMTLLWLLWLAPHARGLSLVRWVAISVYVHSAVSRCDRASLELQWELIAPLLERWEVTTRFIPQRTRLAAAATFAVAELAIALLLAVPRWRKVGCGMSVMMHGLLLLLLGPLGLDHHGGVLVWNSVWIVQNVVLFGGGAAETRERETAGELSRSGSLRSRLATAIAGTVMLAPLLEPWGLWDHWPSWRLYSARPATVAYFVDESRVSELPANVQQFVGRPEPLSAWRPVNLDAWSFAELRCPVYPQARFRLAVALAVTREYALGDNVRVVIGSPPDRWTGEREMREVLGETAIVDASRRFVINSEPRLRGGR